MSICVANDATCHITFICRKRPINLTNGEARTRVPSVKIFHVLFCLVLLLQIEELQNFGCIVFVYIPKHYECRSSEMYVCILQSLLKSLYLRGFYWSDI